jgi:hypothetical protein
LTTAPSCDRAHTPGGTFYGGALGGRIQECAGSGNLTWDYVSSNNDRTQHHDVRPMPNGNVLLIAWDRKTQQQAIAAGRVNVTGEFWPEAFYEIRPSGASGGTVVWEWHLWDHLIQDVDPSKPNFGVVGDHPELLDINLPGGAGMGSGDWMHANAIDYHQELDQITFSSHYLNEIYVIDHSTTTQQAGSHAGGNSGMGGDILYRWGNPQNYRAGDANDQVFFVVHGANWIDPGCPGQGHLLAFNNGDRPGSQNDYSSVVEIVPPPVGWRTLTRPQVGEVEVAAGGCRNDPRNHRNVGCVRGRRGRVKKLRRGTTPFFCLPMWTDSRHEFPAIFSIPSGAGTTAPRAVGRSVEAAVSWPSAAGH